jgi:hypothetical protein
MKSNLNRSEDSNLHCLPGVSKHLIGPDAELGPPQSGSLILIISFKLNIT